MKLHVSGEDYLEVILVLQKEKGMIRSVNMARHMRVFKPSVCHAVAVLRVDGSLTMDGDFSLHLIDVGREVAEQTYEKHCFFTYFLMGADVNPKAAKRDACRMEHVINPASPRKLVKLYQKAHPSTEPTENERRSDVETNPTD